MALVIGDNFDYQGQQPNFARDTFATLAEMKAFPETSIDEGHISLCLDTGKRYKYFSGNTVDPITGKWRLEIDTALDATSENSVQNKVIYNKFVQAEKDLADKLKKSSEDIEKTINGLKEKVSQYDDIIIEGDQVSAKAITELKDYIENCHRVIAAAIRDIKINTANLSITVNGHPLSEGNLDLTKSDIGLGNVDNTSDSDKPLSNASIIALDGKVDKKDGYGLIGDGDYQKLNNLPSSAQLDTRISDVQDEILEHQRDKSNPHEVTMEQIGVDVELNKKVDKTTTINGHPLSENVELGKSSVGLNYVDNTSDLEKPVSKDQQKAIDNKADELSNLVAYSLAEINKTLIDFGKTTSTSLNEIWKRIVAGGLRDIESLNRVGTSSEFPVGNIPVGFQYFCTTDNLPYWWTGTEWKGGTV